MTSETKTNNECARFESWFTKRHGAGLMQLNAAGFYAWHLAQDKWEVWQAACVQAEVAQWQPIETAPRDGTKILLYGQWQGEINGMRNDVVAVGAWGGGRSDRGKSGWWDIINTDGYACWIYATHWMPLPAPPNKEST